MRRLAHEHAVVAESAVRIEGGVGLGDHIVFFLVCCEVADLARHDPPVFHHSVRSLNEAEFVDFAVGAERADEGDVGAFWGFNRAHSAIVREVDVAHFEAGALTGEAAWAERGEPPAVGEPGQRVHLIHELAELAGGEEFLYGSSHRAGVDETFRRDRLGVLGGHALAHHSFHARQPDAHLVLDELADCADATVGEMVLVVQTVALHAVGEVEQIGAGSQHL